MAKTETRKQSNAKRKTKLAVPHATGILVPPWWRGNRALGVLALSVGSVIAALIVIGSASDRVMHVKDMPDSRQDVAANTRLVPESILPEEPYDGGETTRHDEEPLPTDVYEHAPVMLPDPSAGILHAIEDPGAAYDAEPLGAAYAVNSGDRAGENVTTAKPAKDEPTRFQGGTDERQIAALPSPVEQIERHSESAGPPAIPESAPDADPTPSLRTAPTTSPPPWRKFALPFQSIENRPLVAIVIDDMGVSKRYSAAAVQLPGPLTMSYLTYARDVNEQAMEARQNGHEIMLHVPMEPSSPTVDPGPNVLKAGMARPEVVANLIWGMKRLDGFVGINNHMGSRFTQDADGMRAVLETVAETGHLFLDSRTSGSSVASRIAREIGLPFVSRNVFIDHDDDPDVIAGQLRQVERLAERNGAVIAIGHPRPKTIEALREWLPGLGEKGLQLAPVTAVVLRSLEESGQDVSSR